MKKEEQVLVYKKYLNKSSGTTVYLTDRVYEQVGDLASSLLYRLDSEIYTLEKGKYIPIPTMRPANVEKSTPPKKGRGKSKAEAASSVDTDAATDTMHNVDAVSAPSENLEDAVSDTNDGIKLINWE